MATRSALFALKNSYGVVSIYNHYDGYPAGVLPGIAAGYLAAGYGADVVEVLAATRRQLCAEWMTLPRRDSDTDREYEYDIQIIESSLVVEVFASSWTGTDFRCEWNKIGSYVGVNLANFLMEDEHTRELGEELREAAQTWPTMMALENMARR